MDKAWRSRLRARLAADAEKIASQLATEDTRVEWRAIHKTLLGKLRSDLG